MEFTSVLLRWAHISSATGLLGGILYARFVRGAMGADEAARFRQLAYAAMGLLLLSGTFNLLTTSAPQIYQMVFGVKALLALHVFAVTMVLARPGTDDAKRLRLLTGMAISGLLIVALSACLRILSR